MTAPNPNNCIAYYKLDETSGTTAFDSTPNEHDGTANNARVFTSEVTGVVNTGADFTQGNDYIDLNDKFTFIPDTLTFTVSVWVRFEDWNDGDVSNIITNSDFSDDGGLYIRLDQRGSTNRLQASVGRGSNTGNSFQINFNSFNNNHDLNTWYHIVYTADGTNAYLYVDNVEVGTSSSFTSMLAPPIHNLQIGRSGRNERFLDGYVDEVAIFDRALTTQEIEFLYASGSPGSEQQYPFSSTPPPFTITTQTATNIFSNQATLNGEVSDFE